MLVAASLTTTVSATTTTTSEATTAEAWYTLQSLRCDDDIARGYCAILICGARHPDLHSGFQVSEGSLSGFDDDRLVVHGNRQRALLSLKGEPAVGYALDGAEERTSSVSCLTYLTGLASASPASESTLFLRDDDRSREGAAIDSLTDDHDLRAVSYPVGSRIDVIMILVFSPTLAVTVASSVVTAMVVPSMLSMEPTA